MSLLLDALKKAADDKEKASRGEASTASTESGRRDEWPDERRGDTKPGGATVSSSTEELSLQPAVPSVNEIDNEEELTLDVEQEDERSLTSADDVSDQSDRNVEPAEAERSRRKTRSNNRSNTRRSGASKFTVSDDALSLLIDKTNRDVKKSKRFFVIGVVFTSLLILLSGGLYYYTDMQAEIAAVERRHQSAMLAMRLKTNQEKTPDKSAIIRNLVSDAALEEKVQYAKSQISSKKKAVTTRPPVQPERVKKVDNTQLSIKRTNKSDPVGETLDEAWLAYENGDYAEAKRLYKDTLRIEGDNRDAQLGLGAIAVIEKDVARARNIYLALLQQDPADPIATAALTSLSSDKSSLKSDNDYLLSLLEKNPDAPQLNFSVGNNYAQQDKWKSAQQYYFKAWQLDGDNADYIFNLAVSMDQLGKPQQAINFYRDSLVKSMNRQVSFSRQAVQKRINELAGL